MNRNLSQGFGRRTLAALILVPALLAACAGFSSPTVVVSPSAGPALLVSPTAMASVAVTSPTPTPAATATKGPASAQFAAVGTNGLTGALTITQIYCNQPSLSGPQVEALGAYANGNGFVLFASAIHIEVRASTGDGATLKLRSFVGSGVTAFDSSTGATFDSDLTESTTAGAAIGVVGALSHLKGSLDCGNEQTGSANIVLTGNDTAGAMSSALTSVVVTCTITAGGTYVGAQGLGMAGTTPVLVFVTASSGHLQVSVENGTVGTFYSNNGAGVTIGVDGAHISADVVEEGKAGVAPHMLRVEGSDTCGNTIHM